MPDEPRDTGGDDETRHDQSFSEAHFSRLQDVIREVGLENGPNLLAFSAAVAFPDLMRHGMDTWAASRAAVEEARIRGEHASELALIAAEKDRAGAVERTRLATLAAITLVMIAVLIATGCVQDAQLTDGAAVIAAFAGLVRLVVGDPAPAQTNEARRQD